MGLLYEAVAKMGGRYGGAGWRSGASGYPSGAYTPPGGRSGSSGFQFMNPGEQRGAPVLEMERSGAGTFWRLAPLETPPSTSLPTVFTPSVAGAVGAVVDSPLAKKILAERALQVASRGVPLLRALETLMELYRLAQMLRGQSEPLPYLSTSYAGFSTTCGPRSPAPYTWTQVAGPYASSSVCSGGPVYTGTGVPPGLMTSGQTSNTIKDQACWSFNGFWYEYMSYSSPTARAPVNRMAHDQAAKYPFGDPRSWQQPVDPLKLPIGIPYPMPEPLPYDWLPMREPRFDRAPDEQREWGPNTARHPWVPIGWRQDYPQVKQPRFWTDGMKVKIGVKEPPGPRRGKEKKKRAGVGAFAVVRAVGRTTEYVDRIAALWDAIPKRECKSGEGPGDWRQLPGVKMDPVGKSGYSFPMGIEIAGGNVSDCSGAKIKYDPPLHRPPYKRSNWRGVPITHPRPQDMLKDLWNHWDKIDWRSGVANLINNELKDQIIGRSAKGARNAFFSSGYAPRSSYFGPGVGPAM